MSSVWLGWFSSSCVSLSKVLYARSARIYPLPAVTDNGTCYAVVVIGKYFPSISLICKSCQRLKQFVIYSTGLRQLFVIGCFAVSAVHLSHKCGIHDWVILVTHQSCDSGRVIVLLLNCCLCQFLKDNQHFIFILVC